MVVEQPIHQSAFHHAHTKHLLDHPVETHRKADVFSHSQQGKRGAIPRICRRRDKQEAACSVRSNTTLVCLRMRRFISSKCTPPSNKAVSSHSPNIFINRNSIPEQIAASASQYSSFNVVKQGVSPYSGNFNCSPSVHIHTITM